MGRSSKNKKAKRSARPTSTAAKPRPTDDTPPATHSPPGTWSERLPVLRFVAIFVGLCAAMLYLRRSVTTIETGWFAAYLEMTADVSSWLLNLFGEPTTATGATVGTSEFSVKIARGCDALEPLGMFVAAIVAFPAAIRLKLYGIAAGLVILPIINLARVVTLYYTGVLYPEAFETMHLDVWQILFIVLTMALWLVWAIRVTAPRGDQLDASA